MRPRFKSGRVKITKLGLKVVKHLQLIRKIEKYGFSMVPLRSQEKYMAQALENHFPTTERFQDFISRHLLPCRVSLYKLIISFVRKFFFASFYDIKTLGVTFCVAMETYRIYTCIEHMEYLELNSITF